MRRSFLEAFNEKIGVMMSNGIANRWFSMYMSNNRIKKVVEASQPQVLTIADLEVGFKFCLVPLSLSVISFICELMSARVKSVLQSFRDRLVAVSVIKAWIQALVGRM